MEPIFISALNHYDYCPRRCYLMFILCEFKENPYTVEGEILHDRAHNEGRTKRRDLLQLRRVYVFSKKYNLVGIADLIEEKANEIYPVEYKRGRMGEWKNDRLQLCAQGLCLEEMTNRKIDKGYIFYASSGRRKEVVFDDKLRLFTTDTIEMVKELFLHRKDPGANLSKRCRGCSLYSVCLPKETKLLKKQIALGVK